jgi:2-oxoisovalerate dehydrogenase E1 component alpha subunit
MVASLKVGQYSAQLSAETLLEMYWFMLLSRRTDERAWALHRQGKIAFHISAIGHEATQVAAAFATNRGVDFAYPYYRDLAMVLAMGITPEDFMRSLFGKADEISSGARQMPSHWSSKAHNIVTQSASVATQVPHAAGTAFAIKYKLQTGLQDAQDMQQPRLALTCLGEGSTSQGEWHEGMNWAGVHDLPFICLVQNNNYAISVPYDKQSGTPDVAERASAYGVHGVVVDGNDVLAVYDVMCEAVKRAYNLEGATLVEAKTTRLVPHSSDDDDRSYRSREELEAEKERDPLPRFQKYLLEQGILNDDLIAEYDQRARKIVDAAQKAAVEAPYPPVESMYGDVFAPLEEEV